MLAFGIVAPEATHRTSFEEHSGADARSIVQGEALNVENNICGDHDATVKEGMGDAEGVREEVVLAAPSLLRLSCLY